MSENPFVALLADLALGIVMFIITKLLVTVAKKLWHKFRAPKETPVVA
jgi:hypothetical protein